MRTPIAGFMALMLVACVAKKPEAPAQAEPEWPEIAADHDSGSLVEEAKLDLSDVDDAAEANCLRLIHQCSRPGGCANPVPNIRAVNALVPFGTDGALRILRNYVRLTAGERARFDDFPSRVFTVARLAFVPAAGGKPLRKPGIGSFGLVVKADSAHWDSYPFVLREGIPFDMSQGLMLGGVPEVPNRYLDYLQKEAVLRTEPLVPADNPLDAVDRLIESDTWKDIRFSGDEPGHKWFLHDGGVKARLRAQALGALSNIYRPSREVWESFSYTGEYQWEDHLKAVRALNPSWDTAKQKYFKGG